MSGWWGLGKVYSRLTRCPGRYRNRIRTPRHFRPRRTPNYPRFTSPTLPPSLSSASHSLARFPTPVTPFSFGWLQEYRRSLTTTPASTCLGPITPRVDTLLVVSTLVLSTTLCTVAIYYPTFSPTYKYIHTYIYIHVCVCIYICIVAEDKMKN